MTSSQTLLQRFADGLAYPINILTRVYHDVRFRICTGTREVGLPNAFQKRLAAAFEAIRPTSAPLDALEADFDRHIQHQHQVGREIRVHQPGKQFDRLRTQPRPAP